MPTVNYFVAPEDGWTQVASNTSFIRVSTVPETHPYFLWSGSSVPTTLDQIGVRLQYGDLIETVSNSETFWVRVQSPVSGSAYSGNKLRFDILYGNGGAHGASLLMESGSYLLLEDGSSQILLE